MRMPKAWPLVASALTLQLGWGAEWKVLVMWRPAFWMLHLTCQSALVQEGTAALICKSFILASLRKLEGGVGNTAQSALALKDSGRSMPSLLP